MAFNAVKDSGARQDFSTGSRRDTREGKGRHDLVSPIVEQRDAKHLENGAAKYGDRNWELGQPLSRFLDSAKRHISKFQEGHRDEDHLAAARWNLGCIIHIEEMISRGLLPATLNDLPSYLAEDPKGGQKQPKAVPLVGWPEWVPAQLRVLLRPGDVLRRDAKIHDGKLINVFSGVPSDGGVQGRLSIGASGLVHKGGNSWWACELDKDETYVVTGGEV